MVLLVFLLISGLAILLWWLSRGAHPEDMIPKGPKDADPLEIAKRRYARGDITTQEFEEIRERLQ